MKKIEVLKRINVGARIAEQEIDGLKDYFLKTFLWEQLISDEIDVVFGCKGSGKSAIYNTLSTIAYDLIDVRIILALAENPRGTVAFKDLSGDFGNTVQSFSDQSVHFISTRQLPWCPDLVFPLSWSIRQH